MCGEGPSVYREGQGVAWFWGWGLWPRRRARDPAPRHGIFIVSSAYDDERWMREALALARLAEAEGEVPVGAVVVRDGVALGTGRNAPIRSADPTAHAEMVAIREAAAAVGNYRLTDCDLYVTLEPCVMCAGLIVNARIRRLIFGARDLRFGGVRSKFQLADSPLLNHRVDVVEGVLGEEATRLLREFFASRRP